MPTGRAQLVSVAVGWPAIGSAVAASVTCIAIALELQQPAFAVVQACATIVAIVLVAKLTVWVAGKGHTFGREERLATVVMFGAVVVGWFGMRQWVAERRFSYLVATQNAELKATTDQLAAEILAFVADRDRHAPPPPQPATWEQDEGAIMRFDAETATVFETRFGRQVRAAHDILRLLGIEDRDFEVFYNRPANDFQIRIVGRQLAALSAKIRS